MKKKLTDDIDLRNEILIKLKENNRQYGKPYCPCVNPEFYSDDYICPCKDFRTNCKTGEECHCGLYIKIEE